MLGWLVAIYPLMQFMATPILGQLSDRYGRKKVLAFSIVGTSLGYVLFALGIHASLIWLLFVTRALDGITGGNISVARAVIADVTTPEHRARNFGLMGAAFGMGFVLGPYIGARLAAPNVGFFGLFNTPGWFEPATPFWFAAILSLINVVLVMLVLPETHRHINDKLKMAWNKSLVNIKQAVTHPKLKVMYTSEFLYWSGFTFFTTFFQILLIEKLHFKVNNVGDFFAYIGIWIAFVQVAITPVLAKRFKPHQIIRMALIGSSVALLLMLFPENTTELLLVTPLIALFNGNFMANATALISNSVDGKIQGEVLGIEASVQALGQAIPAIIAGYIATMGVNVPVLVGAAVIAVGGLIFILFYRPTKQVLHQPEPTVSIGH